MKIKCKHQWMYQNNDTHAMELYYCQKCLLQCHVSRYKDITEADIENLPVKWTNKEAKG